MHTQQENASPSGQRNPSPQKAPRIAHLHVLPGENNNIPNIPNTYEAYAPKTPEKAYIQHGTKRPGNTLTPGSRLEPFGNPKRVCPANNWMSPHSKRRMEAQGFGDARKMYRVERALATTQRDDTLFSFVPERVVKKPAPGNGMCCDCVACLYCAISTCVCTYVCMYICIHTYIEYDDDKGDNHDDAYTAH